MTKLSFNKLIKSFYLLLITTLLIIISIATYKSFEELHKQALLKIEQSNSQKIDHLVHNIKSKHKDIVSNFNLSQSSKQAFGKEKSTLEIQENIYSLILDLLKRLDLPGVDLPSRISLLKSKSKTSLKELDQIVKLLQVHNESINKELQKQFLHPEELKRLNRKLKSDNSNQFQTPFRLNVYQINEYQHKKLVRRFQELSSRRKWNVDFKGDFNNRSITLSSSDANRLDKLDGIKDGIYKLNSKLRSGSLITVYVERVTWSLPNSDLEKQQTVLSEKFKMRSDINQKVLDQIQVESPMIIVGCYLLSKRTFFGESTHPFFGGAELFIRQLRNYENGVDTNHLMFHTATYPPDISNHNLHSDQVYIFPRNAIVLMLDKRWLIRSLVSKLLETKKLTNVFIEFADDEAKVEVYKLNHLSKAISLNEHKAKSYLTQHKKISWNKETPVHTIEKINSRKSVLTSKIIRLGSKFKFRVYLWQPLDRFYSSLYTDYLYLFLSLIIIFCICITIKNSWNKLQEGMQDCINLVVSGVSTSGSSSPNELKILARSISLFNQQIKWRKEFSLLKRRILHVINVPRLEPNQYLEELNYACRDTAERFAFQLLPSDQVHPFSIKVQISKSWQEDLKISGSIIHFGFNGPLRDLEIEQLNHDLQTLIKRAELQSHLRKADQLEADVELSTKLQRVLDPIKIDNELIPNNIQIEPILVRTNQMQFDAMDQIVNNNRINIYHIDLNDRGLSSALLSTSLKSILHSLLQLDLSPSETLLEFNSMVLAQEIANLFVSCAVLQIDINNNLMKFCSAGHGGLWHRTEGGYTCLHREGIPLGIKSNPKLVTWSKSITGGDYCLFSNNVHLANHLPDLQIYNHKTDLNTIAKTIVTNIKESNLEFDYCAWLIRIL